MECIEWTNKLETGVSIIDSQHRVLVSLINQLQIASAEVDQRLRQLVLKLTLDHLLSYTNYHFLTEEKLMEFYDCKDSEDHQIAHTALTTKLHEVIKLFNAGEDVMQALLIFLKYWLQSHILTSDMKSFSIAKK